MGVPVVQPLPAEQREKNLLGAEAERFLRWWRWHYRFLRDFNWLCGDIERLAAASGRADLARGEEVPEGVFASLDFSIQQRRKIWPELLLLADTERNGPAIYSQFRKSLAV